MGDKQLETKTRRQEVDDLASASRRQSPPTSKTKTKWDPKFKLELDSTRLVRNPLSQHSNLQASCTNAKTASPTELQYKTDQEPKRSRPPENIYDLKQAANDWAEVSDLLIKTNEKKYVTNFIDAFQDKVKENVFNRQSLLDTSKGQTDQPHQTCKNSEDPKDQDQGTDCIKTKTQSETFTRQDKVNILQAAQAEDTSGEQQRFQTEPQAADLKRRYSFLNSQAIPKETIVTLGRRSASMQQAYSSTRTSTGSQFEKEELKFGEGTFPPNITHLSESRPDLDPDPDPYPDSALYFANDKLTSWQSKRQKTKSRKAEYVSSVRTSVPVYIENTGAAYLANNPVNNQRSKHIDIRVHHAQDWVKKKLIDIVKIYTADDTANLFTSNIARQVHQPVLHLKDTKRSWTCFLRH